MKKPLKNTIVCFFVIWTVLKDIKIFEEFYMIGGRTQQSRRGESSDKITKAVEYHKGLPQHIASHVPSNAENWNGNSTSLLGQRIQMARFILETVIRLGRAWAKNGSSSDNPTVNKYGQSGRIIYPHDL